MRNILIIAAITCACCFTSCKEKEENDLILKTVIQGKITYEDYETGQEGNAAGAIVKIHLGNEEGELKQVTADNTGFYQMTGIAVNTLVNTKIYYQLSGEYTATIGGDELTFIGRSDSISIKGNDTIVCNILLER